MFYFMNFVCSFVNYAIFHELCDWMRFEVDCVKSHHRVISEGLILILNQGYFSFNNCKHNLPLSILNCTVTYLLEVNVPKEEE